MSSKDFRRLPPEENHHIIAEPLAFQGDTFSPFWRTGSGYSLDKIECGAKGEEIGTTCARVFQICFYTFLNFDSSTLTCFVVWLLLHHQDSYNHLVSASRCVVHSRMFASNSGCSLTRKYE